VANFVVAFVGIDHNTLQPYREKKVSLASTVGKYMLAEMPSHAITLILQRLISVKQ